MAQTVCIILSPADRERLAAIVADRSRQRKHIERAQVILASAEGGTVQQIAAQLGVGRPMVWRWQQRFAAQGVDGLLRDKTRKPGKPPIPAETVERVVALTCGKPPGESTHWTGQQDLGSLQLAGGMFATAQHSGELIALVLVQLHPIPYIHRLPPDFEGADESNAG